MMKKWLFLLSWLVIAIVMSSCKTDGEQTEGIRIAIISDAHIQDVVGHPELIRSQEAQVQSTRLFNENYFALCAALEDCGKRGIKTIVMPGDLTDDGQLVAQECARNILKTYADKYGMQFFVTVGNHDPQQPLGYDVTKTDYLGDDGRQVSISSDEKSGADIIYPQLRGAGYAEQTACYSDFGFFPQEKFKYWATPYSTYGVDDYTYEKALAESGIDKRTYDLQGIRAYDASYVVEPIDNLWLLAIDGAVHIPKDDGTFHGSAKGYNNWMPQQNHLVEWIKSVAATAKERGKTLIAFCHFPIVDFNDSAGDLIKKYWGEDKFDLARVPSKEITDAIRQAGINVHIGGHMHVNDTGVDGDFLVNIQVPCLGVCVPAYKILTIKNSTLMDVETVTMGDVPGFDSLFDRYQREYDHDIANGKQPVWSIEALKSKNYLEFCDWHFRDLTRLRFIPRDIPSVLREQIIDKNGKEILQLVDAKATAEETMTEWTGFDLMLDLYRLRYGSALVLDKATNKRISQYHKVFDAANAVDSCSELTEQIRALGEMFDCFLNDEPNLNFTIDLEKKTVTER